MYTYGEPFVVMSRIYQCVFGQCENLLSQKDDESERTEGTFSIIVLWVFFLFLVKNTKNSFYVLACEWTESYNLSELPPCHRVRRITIDIKGVFSRKENVFLGNIPLRNKMRSKIWKVDALRLCICLKHLCLNP